MARTVRIVSALLLLILSQLGFAEVKVAFLRRYDASGQAVRLERDGPGFFHVAIQVNDLWLHAHPFGGVQLSKSLEMFGSPEEYLVNPHLPEPTTAEIQKFLGRSYDKYFKWNDDSYYCSEIVGLLLGIPPKPMRFEGEYWELYFSNLGIPAPSGGLGISPDGLYNHLISNGYQSHGPLNCSSLLYTKRIQ